MGAYDMKIANAEYISYIRDKKTGKYLKKATRPLVKERRPAWKVIDGVIYTNGFFYVDIMADASAFVSINMPAGTYKIEPTKVSDKLWKYTVVGEPYWGL